MYSILLAISFTWFAGQTRFAADYIVLQRPSRLFTHIFSVHGAMYAKMSGLKSYIILCGFSKDAEHRNM